MPREQAMNAEYFAGRLKELREQAGLTQQQLADRAGLTRDGVAQLGRGRRKPAWETVVALISALECGAEAFTQRPAPRAKPGQGRPPKRTRGTPAPEEPKRPRGRPRKTT